MIPITRTVNVLVMTALVVGCGALAFVWPGWRAELQAQGAYCRITFGAAPFELVKGERTRAGGALANLDVRIKTTFQTTADPAAKAEVDLEWTVTVNFQAVQVISLPGGGTQTIGPRRWTRRVPVKFTQPKAIPACTSTNDVTHFVDLGAVRTQAIESLRTQDPLLQRASFRDVSDLVVIEIGPIDGMSVTVRCDSLGRLTRGFRLLWIPGPGGTDTAMLLP